MLHPDRARARGPRPGVVRRLLALACLLLVAAGVAGCTETPATGDKGYITGEGRVTVVAPAERGEPVVLEGESLDGEPLSLADLRGQVVVVNVWWSGCPPCRAEQPELVAAAEELAQKAEFVGINIRDASPEQAQAYVRSFDVPYPSVYSPDGEALLAFAGTLTPRSIPSTVVLDTRGRVAAAIIGQLPSQQTLVDVVEEVSSER